MNGEEILAWQREFFNGPFVWATQLGSEFLCFYDSEEAAEIEVAWRKKRHPKEPPTRIVKCHIHTLKLSQERWT